MRVADPAFCGVEGIDGLNLAPSLGFCLLLVTRHNAPARLARAGTGSRSTKL